MESWNNTEEGFIIKFIRLEEDETLSYEGYYNEEDDIYGSCLLVNAKIYSEDEVDKKLKLLIEENMEENIIFKTYKISRKIEIEIEERQ